MGGFGSGTWTRWNVKKKAEHQHRIDLRSLKKDGCLHPGKTGRILWTQGGEETGSISFNVQKHQMLLRYGYRNTEGETTQVEQILMFDRTSCHYGGYRVWFICEGCGGRGIVLYGTQQFFLCRSCSNINYESQRKDEADRLIAKARKIRKRLLSSTDITEPIGPKPKGMHLVTYQRLREEAELNVHHAIVLMAGQLGLI